MTWSGVRRVGRRFFTGSGFDEEESPRFAAFKERLAELHPDWEIRTWQDSSELRWLRNQKLFDQWFEKDPYGRIPDILRYELLWKFGGVYIDTDFEPLRPLDVLLEDPRPFAAWENERTMCTAILGAPPQHPAIDALITNLPAHAKKMADRTPNYATGPEFATKIWRGREDVRRLPPICFYPVGWWETHRLGIEYPPETFAVHHWARGWGEEAAPKPKDGEPLIVILVPWRPGDPDREAAWQFVQRSLKPLGWPIICGDAKGPWNRSSAINAASKAAGAWDVAVIIDADTIENLPALQQAALDAHKKGSAVVPWNERWKLSKAGSERFLRRGARDFQQSQDLDRFDRTRPRGVRPEKRGGSVVVSREAWDAVGGFDEGFVDWGHEDRAFRQACMHLAPGGLEEMKSTVWHLWHPLASEDRKGSQEGRDRFARYYESGTPGQMSLLLREFGML